MLSRVADSIYWMSRYIERAENVARFVDVNLHLMLDSPMGQEQQWQPLVNTTGDHELFAKRYGEATQQNVIQFLTFDPENPNSILSCLRVGPRKRPLRPRDHLVRDVGAAQQLLPDGEGGGERPPDDGRPARVLHRGEGGQPPLQRHHRRHHDARTRPGISARWAGCWSARTRPRAFST